jgi:hypothetical protein
MVLSLPLPDIQSFDSRTTKDLLTFTWNNNLPCSNVGIERRSLFDITEVEGPTEQGDRA